MVTPASASSDAGLTADYPVERVLSDLEHPGAPDAAGGGWRVGRHHVTGYLGQGGMGQVLRVRDPELRRDLAVKLMLGGADESARRKFVREAQITGQLEHPNIVPIHELGLSPEGEPFFTMKEIVGETLRDILRRMDRGPEADDRRWSLVHLLEVFLKVCDAIAFAHSRGVIHRDLKPDNVMLGRFGEVMLMDWGLAARLDEQEQPAGDGAFDDPRFSPPAERTLDGKVLGTPSYMAPEQAAGEVSKVDRRSDVYALGVMLYEILTWQRAFGGESAGEVLDDVLAGRFERPSVRAPQRTIPWELEAVVLRAMAYRRLDRYPDVVALRADVASFLEGRVLAAVRYSPWQRLGRWAWRRRTTLGLVLLGLLALGLAGGWGYSSYRDRQAFAAHRADALRAQREGNWQAAVEAGQQALALFDDAELTRWLSTARDRAREERRRQAAALEAARRRAALDREIGPIARQIEEARPFFHIGRVEIRVKLAQLERSLALLDPHAARLEHARHERLWSCLGSGWLLAGDLDRAQAALERAVALAGDDGWPGYFLGRLYLARALVDDLTRVEGDGEQSLRAWLVRAARVLQSSQGKLGGAGPVHQQILAAWRALAAGQWARARALARAGREEFARSLEAAEFCLIEAWTERKLGRAAEALVACGRALDWKPHDAWAYMVRGATRWDRREAGPALADFEAALAINPRLAPALLFRGLVRRARRDVPGAIADYSAAIALQRGFAVAYYNRANARLLQRDLPGAADDYGEALRLRPDFWRARVNRGRTRYDARDWAGALADYQAAVRAQPGNWQAWFGLGRTLQVLGRSAEARGALSKAEKLRPPGERR